MEGKKNFIIPESKQKTESWRKNSSHLTLQFQGNPSQRLLAKMREIFGAQIIWLVEI